MSIGIIPMPLVVGMLPIHAGAKALDQCLGTSSKHWAAATSLQRTQHSAFQIALIADMLIPL